MPPALRHPTFAYRIADAVTAAAAAAAACVAKVSPEPMDSVSDFLDEGWRTAAAELPSERLRCVWN
eukprot:COSAG05_NODE_8_length_40675_cov_148.837539_14_plen_66_part_00